MAAFRELDWTRFDVWSVVENRGIAVVDPRLREDCTQWLRLQNYTLVSVDFGSGIEPGARALRELLRWESQFGHPATGSLNLDALRDGFDFELEPGDGCVLELLNPEIAFRENSRWFSGLLAIASEYTIQQLALGARFFTILYADADSRLIGSPLESLYVSTPWGRGQRWNSPEG